MKRTPLAAAAAVVLASLPAVAHAQDYVETKGPASQSVVFRDDPLDALPLGAAGATLAVRPTGARMLLLRPRVHFISEMLKSVEAL